MLVPDKEKEIIRKYFPILLREDPAFREEVMAELTGVLATKDDIAKILTKLDEHSKILNQHSEILEEHLQTLREHSKILREHSQTLQEHTKILQEHTYRMDKFDIKLTALGARWGIFAEESFRAGMRGIVEGLGHKVSKWRVRDNEGIVYGKPTMVEADVLIKDNKHCLIEIKSSISEFDVAGFNRLGKLYKKLKDIEPRLIIISPFISKGAEKLSDDLGIEYYTAGEEAFRN